MLKIRVLSNDKGERGNCTMLVLFYENVAALAACSGLPICRDQLYDFVWVSAVQINTHKADKSCKDVRGFIALMKLPVGWL